MTDFKQLIIYREAIELVRGIAQLTGQGRGLGDLLDQLQRAAISVPSNIAEGAALGTDRQFRKYLCTARGSVNEVEAQLDIIAAIYPDMQVAELTELASRIGKRLTCLIRRIHQRLTG